MQENTRRFKQVPVEKSVASACAFAATANGDISQYYRYWVTECGIFVVRLCLH